MVVGRRGFAVVDLAGMRAERNSGRRPRARVLAGGLRLVTDLRCILLMVFKNIVFYGVLGPSASKNFMLALSKNHAFYVALGFRGGPRTEKMTC